MSREQLKILTAEKIPVLCHSLVSFVKSAFSLQGWTNKEKEWTTWFVVSNFFLILFFKICHILALFYQPGLKTCLEAAHLAPNSLSKQYSSHRNWQAILAAVVTESISWSFQEANLFFFFSPCLTKFVSSLNVTGEKLQVSHEVGYSDEQCKYYH